MAGLARRVAVRRKKKKYERRREKKYISNFLAGFIRPRHEPIPILIPISRVHNARAHEPVYIYIYRHTQATLYYYNIYIVLSAHACTRPAPPLKRNTDPISRVKLPAGNSGFARLLFLYLYRYNLYTAPRILSSCPRSAGHAQLQASC